MPSPSRLRLLAIAASITSLIFAPTGFSADDRPLRDVIDAELKTTWDKHAVRPAPQSGDGEFLRRVTLDLIGTVPTYEETVTFLADTDAKKRQKLLDKLLADPRFATAQANVWDQVFFGRNPGNGDATRKREPFKTWLTQQFAENVPYDVWVRELLLAEKAGPELFYVQFRNQPEDATVAVSKTFLGLQLQCARCHDHPYDQWTQRDFYGMTGFFVRLVVQEAGSGEKKTFTIGEKSQGEVLFSGAAKDQAPGKKGEPVRPKFLGGTVLDEPASPMTTKETPLKTGEKLPKPKFSRKEKFAAWVATTENPYFARAAVNRVWAQFMGRGIVHPVDDFNEQNAATHPALLHALTDGFAAHHFDLKWLIREIVSSRGYQLSRNGTNRDALPKTFEQARIRPLSAEEIVAAMRLVTGYDLTVKPGDKLGNSGNEYFLRYFGEPTNGLGDFQGSLHEHLFMNNGEYVRRFISRKKGNLADAVLSSAEPAEKKVERLYLTVLQRAPSAREREAFVNYLGGPGKPEPLVEDLIWVLLNSSEFRFNH